MDRRINVVFAIRGNEGFSVDSGLSDSQGWCDLYDAHDFLQSGKKGELINNIAGNLIGFMLLTYSSLPFPPKGIIISQIVYSYYSYKTGG
jgi:hypothetical protein